jgi:cell division protein ZapE
MDVVHLQGDVDYRRHKLSLEKPYFTPCNEETFSQLQTCWDEMTEGALKKVTSIKGQGPSLTLEGLAKGVAWANFDPLCCQAYGRGEYLALAETIHTLILWGIPQMSREDHNEALRFTTLIDILYDKGIWLVAAADVEPEYLYQQGGSFDRTISRLYEMQHG